MELELWAEGIAAVSAVAAGRRRRPEDTHCTALIVRVHLWFAPPWVRRIRRVRNRIMSKP